MDSNNKFWHWAKGKKINFLNPKIIITTARGIHAKPLTEFVFFQF